MAEFLKDKYHVVSFDLPGHGKTPNFEKDEDYGASHLTNWVVALLEHIGKETFHIVAHSWEQALRFTMQPSVQKK